MKETKVYVDELPKSCINCPCCSCDLKPELIKVGELMYCNLLKQKFRFKEGRKKLKDCPLIDIKTHDREKDKRIKELEQKVQELQEIDNKRAFRLYSVLYDLLEIQDPENVASRIDYLTGKNYNNICELYKTAKNLKQHDRELVKEVCEKIRNAVNKSLEEIGGNCNGELYGQYICKGLVDYDSIEFDEILDQIQKEFEDE